MEAGMNDSGVEVSICEVLIGKERMVSDTVQRPLTRGYFLQAKVQGFMYTR
jgi:hypothetical protein